ncbi:TetR/AcrR family transcriptional regulator [Bounagaea algeriensis]
MPKLVDREAARREIAAALLSVLAEQGIDAVSVRTVATAAGRSPGAVQKYFATKDEMLAAALELYCERSGARIDAVARDGDPVETVTALVAATLPLDEPRRVDTLVLHEFALRAARDERLADRLRVLDQQIQDELTAYLGTAPETAAAIIALSDGLAMRLLYGSQTPSQALAALRTGIAAVLAQPPTA